MRSLAALFLMMLAAPLFAQQQVIPMDFNDKQSRDFVRLTEAVSAPCCANGIPVAYHASGMAEQIRGQIETWIREDRSRGEIMELLADMPLGPTGEMRVIFTVPGKGWLSVALYAAGPVVIILGFLFVFLMALKKGTNVSGKGGDELLDKYRDHINAQVNPGS